MDITATKSPTQHIDLSIHTGRNSVQVYICCRWCRGRWWCSRRWCLCRAKRRRRSRRWRLTWLWTCSRLVYFHLAHTCSWQFYYYYYYYYYTRLTASFPGQPGQAGTRWVNHSGFEWGRRWWGLGMQWHQLDHMQTICTSLQTDNHTNTSSLNFTCRMLFLMPNQQCRSTEGIKAVDSLA